MSTTVMEIYCSKMSGLYQKRTPLPQDWMGLTEQDRRFIVLGHQSGSFRVSAAVIGVVTQHFFPLIGQHCMMTSLIMATKETTNLAAVTKFEDTLQLTLIRLKIFCCANW